MNSRFEQFKEDALALGHERHVDRMKGNGSFEYTEQVIMLRELQNKLSLNLLVYLFGEDEGKILMNIFVLECERNLLNFFSRIRGEYRFYILHQMKTNEIFFAYS